MRSTNENASIRSEAWRFSDGSALGARVPGHMPRARPEIEVAPNGATRTPHFLMLITCGCVTAFKPSVPNSTP
jgi:hypothetical protein